MYKTVFCPRSSTILVDPGIYRQVCVFVTPNAVIVSEMGILNTPNVIHFEEIALSWFGSDDAAMSAARLVQTIQISAFLRALIRTKQQKIENCASPQ